MRWKPEKCEFIISPNCVIRVFSRFGITSDQGVDVLAGMVSRGLNDSPGCPEHGNIS